MRASVIGIRKKSDDQLVITILNRSAENVKEGKEVGSEGAVAVDLGGGRNTTTTPPALGY